ncbi:hypothetical protein GQ53DRAFT_791060 [Thozetella sp. PMI_491]|nr:hypothetical protein GQ53DRAFT_791060 [Thozetella sp. PMI_491]
MTPPGRRIYPGVDTDLRYYPQGHNAMRYGIGAHHNCRGCKSELLTVREVAMMALMDKLTDKPDWYQKVFDEDIVAKWRQEALTQSEDDLYKQIVDGKQHKWHPGSIANASRQQCLQELRQKAEFFKKTGFVPTLDSISASIVKSDTAVPPPLHEALRAAFERLAADQGQDIDWHPNSNDMVRDLVHPSMYPLVFGQSQFLPDESVGVLDAVKTWAGLGEAIPAQGPGDTGDLRIGFNGNYAIGGSTIPPEYWSSNYQWIPANMAFQEDGTAKFTSYINNLHPNKYPEVYKAIEQLVDIAVPAWGHCLIEGDEDRPNVPRVIVTDAAMDENEDLWDTVSEAVARFDGEITAEDMLDLAERNDIDLEEEAEKEWRQNKDSEEDSDEPDEKEQQARQVAYMLKNHEEEVNRWKWENAREPVLPEPAEFSNIQFDDSCADTLKHKFRESGLQVIVKMASIELTPEKPEFPMGGWHIEGMMNEHICGTALYYLDSENITDSHLSFRMQTSSYQDELQDTTGQDQYNWLERVHGTALGPAGGVTNSCLQNYGSVETRQGRMLVFPNTFQHRVSSFKLQDPTRPGHRRFIALWLVDPHERIVSTANVPPQQLDWWVEAVFGGDKKFEASNLPPEVLQLIMERRGVELRAPENYSGLQSRLPNEVMNMIREQGVMPRGLMDVEEAKEHRLKLMAERSRFHETAKSSWHYVQYSFCEH